MFPVILQMTREERDEAGAGIEIQFESFDEKNEKSRDAEATQVPKMKLSGWDSQPPSIVEFYCDDDLENYCEALCGFYTDENFSLDEERTFETEVFLSLSCLESLSSLTEIKGK